MHHPGIYCLFGTFAAAWPASSLIAAAGLYLQCPRTGVERENIRPFAENGAPSLSASNAMKRPPSVTNTGIGA